MPEGRHGPIQNVWRKAHAKDRLQGAVLQQVASLVGGVSGRLMAGRFSAYGTAILGATT